MKKTLHSFHLGENAKTALFAFGFLSPGNVALLPVLVRIVTDSCHLNLISKPLYDRYGG